MSNNAKVSIIVPIYNSEDTLKRCLDSLKAQTYENIEILCVNDGSKDSSLQILQEYANKDSRFIIINQENSGPAKARNAALNISQGEFIMFCDADDWCEPTMVEKMVCAIISKKVDIVMCDCNVIDLISGALPLNNILRYHKLSIKGFHKITNKNIFSINAVLWNKILKKELIDKYNIEYPMKYEHDDLIFLLKYIICSKTYYGLDCVLYNYVSGNPNSIMGKVYNNTNKKSKLDFIYAWQNLYDFLNKIKCKKSLYKKLVKHTWCIIQNFYAKLDVSDREQAQLAIKSLIESNPCLMQNQYFVKFNKYSTFEEIDSMIMEASFNVDFLQHIFSIKNSNSGNYKIIRILGVKIKFKRKK